MKRGYKLKLVMGLGYPLFLVILCKLLVINSGFAQNLQQQNGFAQNHQQQNRFAQNHQQQNSFQGRRIWGGQYPQGRPYYVNPHNAPSSPPPSYPHYGPSPPPQYPNGGGRIVEAVKASIHPLHFQGDNQESYNSPPPLYANGPGIQPSPSSPAQYSGYFYVQDKHRKPYQPPNQPFYTNAYNLPTNNFWTPVAKPSLSSYHPHAPLTRPLPSSSHYPPVPATSGPVTSASMDTYKEALDLFTEVVHKLEREPENGYGIQQSPNHAYPQSSLVSNGIYGASLPSALTSGRFPHHLDHIMGPEFRQKAQKLYNKIIKEQNERLTVSPQQHHPYHVRPPPQSQSPPYNPNLPPRGYGGGLSYLEGMIHGGAPSYGRPSQYARSMVVDSTAGGSPLMDTVKSLEVNVPNSYGQSGGGGGSTEEFMVTSESEMSPQVSLPHSGPEDSHSNSNNHVQEAFAPAQFSAPSSPSAAPEMMMDQQPLASATTSSGDFARNIPLNENDYVEHPLSYDEYEGLIKDLAINHNY